MGYKKHKAHAGDYLAQGTVTQNISPAILEKLQTRMTEVKSILESGNTAQIETLDREDVMGNMHYYARLLRPTSRINQDATTDK